MYAIKVDIYEEIRRPMEEVFDYLIDISNYSKWLPESNIFLNSQQTSVGPPRKGTTFYDNTRFGQLTGEILEFERPKKVLFRQELFWLGILVMESQPEYFLESSPKGTKIHHTGIARFFGLSRLLHSVFEKMAWKERKRVIRSLKKELESVED